MNKKRTPSFSLTITSELDDGRGKKYGLGSSAAVVVTVISALLSFYDLPEIQPTKENIFKLSALAHYRAQGSGSCADIAASTYGGWLEYKMFRPEWLIGKLESGTKVIDLLKMDWPELIIRPLSPPDGLSIAVGWTKKAVSTAPMVKSIQRLRDTNLYEQFLMKSNQAVGKLIQSFEENDCDAALHALTENRYALRFLSEQATVAIETPELKTLIQIANKYGSGKSSGAGGGDCGIAFLKSNDAKTRLIQEWRDAGIDPLQLHVSETGVVINKY